MLKEFLDRFIEHATSAVRPKIMRDNSEAEDVYYLCAPGQGAVRTVAEPHPRAYKAGSIDALASMVGSWGNNPGALSAIWFNRQGVFAYFDETTRRDRVAIDFQHTPQMKRLLCLNDKQWMSQKEILKLLRIDLHGCLESEPGLIPLLRRVVFKADQGSVGQVLPGKASLSREMRAQVDGDTELPETVGMNATIFESLPYASKILCALEVNPESPEKPFSIFPLPGECEAAIQAAEKSVGDRLAALLADAGTDVPLHYGRPS